MTARLPNERIATLAAQATAADKRIAELEAELYSALEGLRVLENQNLSLQTSLDLIVSENLRLSSSLTESDATVDKARFQIEKIKTVLSAAEDERKKLTAEIDAGNEEPELPRNSLLGEDRQFQDLEHLGSRSIENSTRALLHATITF
jgi:chromosome segregation ATPase